MNNFFIMVKNKILFYSSLLVVKKVELSLYKMTITDIIILYTMSYSNDIQLNIQFKKYT